MTLSRVNDVGLNLQIVAHELRRQAAIGFDAADLGRSQKHVLRPLLGEKALDLGLAPQIQFGMAAQYQSRRAAGSESAYERRADQATVAGDINRCVDQTHG